MNIPNAAFAYRENASLGASPLGVVVLLYDRLLQDIHDAVAASKAKQVEVRTAALNHALLILQQLQGRLDFAAGGAAAKQLDDFYSHTRAKLLEAQIRQSPEMMMVQAQALLQLRECWVQVEASSEQVQPVGIANPALPSPERELARNNWGA